MKVSAKVNPEMKQHKPWFDEGYSKLLRQRKQAKLEILNYSSQISGDNPNNVGHEAGRHIRKEKRNI
jgi:hypothetical protein